jgi:hypothetical protein
MWLLNAHWQGDPIRTEVNIQRICKKDLVLLDKFLRVFEIILYILIAIC